MNLIPEPSEPGLWINRDWQPGTPGAYAVIIGVSRYDHLAGGKGPIASETYGLGQLGVSAFTAYQFFCWLRDAFRCSSVTLAKCWLLLSPSPAELNFEPELGRHPLSPLMQNCDDAIGKWYAEMKQLDIHCASESRSFFFFSGHGLQVTEDKQILLPQDYLRPLAENVNRALSTQNLADGVKFLKVPYQFFFLDACRNDHNNLGNVASLDGTPVLTVHKSSDNNPDCVVPLFYASASGTQAWQPPDPSYGPSVYGQALLEGLRAQAGIQPQCAPAPCRVNLYLLEPFVKSRVTEIMRNYQATVGQHVRLRGDATGETVTEVDYLPILAASPPSAYEVRERVFDIRESLAPATVREVSEPHHLFGSENMTEVWWNARLGQLSSGSGRYPDWLPAGQNIVLHKVDRDSGTRTYRVEISLPAGEGAFTFYPGVYWLQFTDRVNNTFVCLLPSDDLDLRYVVELDLDYSVTEGGPRPISRVEVSLSSYDLSPQGRAGALWEKYQMTNVLEAADAWDMGVLEGLVKEKIASPLAATVAGLILLRARRWKQLHNWLRNVANWSDYLPDGPILWVEQLLQQSGKDLYNSTADDAFMKLVEGYWQGPPIRVVDYLTTMMRRGLPTTGEGLAYAARRVEMFLHYGDLTPGDRIDLEVIQDKLRYALRFFRSGGLFCVFAGPESEINPSLVRFIS